MNVLNIKKSFVQKWVIDGLIERYLFKIEDANFAYGFDCILVNMSFIYIYIYIYWVVDEETLP